MQVKLFKAALVKPEGFWYQTMFTFMYASWNLLCHCTPDGYLTPAFRSPGKGREEIIQFVIITSKNKSNKIAWNRDKWLLFGN